MTGKKLTYQTVTGGTIGPRFFSDEPRSETDQRGRFYAGAYHPDGRLVEGSLLERTNTIVEYEQSLTAEKTVDHDVIYAGSYQNHFGHFLLECLSRLWAAKEFPDVPVAWSVPVRNPGAAYSKWQIEMLELLGLTGSAVFVTEPTRFANVIVPEMGFRINDRFHPDHMAFMETAGIAHAPQKGRNIWLSRSKVEVGSGLLGSEVLDRRLAESGWEVFHPQDHSIRTQVETIASADRVASEEGSALHILMFLARAEQLKVDVFPRRPSRKDIAQNYHCIARAKGFQQNLRLVQGEKVLSSAKARTTRLSPNFSAYLDALDIPAAPEGTSPKPTHSSRRLNRLAQSNSASRYLEVGVANGRTFLNVDLPRKSAVDPSFRFDPRNHATRDVQFFEMGSDHYFSAMVRPNERFDLIFLDGLHTFEQTFRDFCASLRHATPNTIWLIDDVFPSDVHAAIPDQAKALQSRRAAGGAGGLWQGDVFKVVLAINDFFPGMDFKTFATKANAQTVVVQKARGTFSPVFNSLEAISRLTYEDFVKLRPQFNPCPDRQIYDWVDEILGKA